MRHDPSRPSQTLRHAIWIAPLAALTAATVVACGQRQAAPHVHVLVQGGAAHGVEGLTFGPDGMIYAASSSSQSILRIDRTTGAVTVAAGPPEGESDDVAVGPAGTPAAGIIVWTSPPTGKLWMQRPGGKPEVLMDNVPGINPVAVTKDGSARFFAAQSGAGDNALYEVYPVDGKPPRLVEKGGPRLNGFDFGPDGKLYAPWQGEDEVLAFDIETGAHTTAAKPVGLPVGVDVDSKGNIYSVDSTSGQVFMTPGAGGTPKVLAQFQAPLDNVTVSADDMVYITAVADSRLTEINPATGAQRVVVPGSFVVPLTIAMIKQDGKDALLVADPLGYRFADPATGAVTRPPWMRNRGSSIAAAANDKFIAIVTSNGRVRKLDPSGDPVVFDLDPIPGLRGVVITSAGDILTVDAKEGRLLRMDADGPHTIVEGLHHPVAISLDGDGAVLVSESDAGVISRIDLATAARTEIAQGLKMPTGVARLPDGRLVVLESGTGTVTAIAPETGAHSVLATDLHLGIGGLRLPVDATAGLAVGADGAIYVSSPLDNTILKIDPEQS